MIHTPRKEEDGWLSCSCDDNFSRFSLVAYEQHRNHPVRIIPPVEVGDK